jgi:hypothetical protein
MMPESNVTIPAGNKSSLIVPQSNITVTSSPRPISSFQAKGGPIITAVIVIPFAISAIFAALKRFQVARGCMLVGFVIFIILIMLVVSYITTPMK